jgi:hypothetical protein
MGEVLVFMFFAAEFICFFTGQRLMKKRKARRGPLL